ncbi:AsmA-like C-terminal region-containing protein [Owenweeksia hongkongensis]|uniref:AsmA-like C-terminal region-containing protein n=1 Tax=Owenweeksia hongkongensis TaxID=253245 RepID=UPI003A8D995D
MKKKIFRLLIWALGLFLLLIIAFAAVLYANRDRIQSVVLTEANKLLDVPVDVEDIDVSLRKFPYASLKFTNVYCRGAQASEQDTLLYAKEMYFEFDLWNAISDDLSIRQISLSDGTLHILRPTNGKPNYEIWKKDTSSSSSSVFTLEQVNFKNFKALQTEGSANLVTRGHISSLTLKGTFTPKNFSITNEGELKIHSLSYNDSTYISQLNARPYFTLSGNLDSSEQSLSITNGVLKLDNQNISFSTSLVEEKTTIKASLSNGNLKELQALAKQQSWYSHPTITITGRGSVDFTGIFETNQKPHLNVAFSTKDALLTGIQKSSISKVNSRGVYTLKNNRDHLHISEFSAKGKTGKISGTLDINDLTQPGIILNLKSDLDISEWLIFVPIDTITEASGKAFVDLHFENKFKSLTNIKPEELKRAKASGKLSLENISFAFKGADKKIENLNGNLAFAGNDLRVNSFSFKTGQSDIFLEGTFANVLNFIYFKDQRLRIDTRVRSKELNMEDFLLGTSKSKNADDDYDVSFVKNLDLDLDLKVDKFHFENFDATGIQGQLQVKGGVIKGKDILLNANDGSYNGQFTIDTRNPQMYTLAASLNGKSIDIHKLFESFKNFGQTVIASDNLYGTANLSVQYLSKIAPSLEIDISTIEMTSNLEIQNGNLKNFDPLLALSDFASIDELRDVHFAKLENNISIRNSQIIIPKMNISSNVLDMGIEGSHGFDNTIDYSIRLKLSDVLFNSRKKKRKRSEFDSHLTVVEGDDDPNIYIKMTGSVDDPSITLDRKNISKSINQDLKNQKQELKEIFTKEEKETKEDDSGIQFDLFGEEDDGDGK